METNNNKSIISSRTSNTTVLGSNDSYFLLNVFPNDIADNLFYQLRHEISWNKMRQKGGR